MSNELKRRKATSKELSQYQKLMKSQQYSNVEMLYMFRDFLTILENGYEEIEDKKVVVCSTVRDCSDKLYLFFKKLERLSLFFGEIHYILVENDSSDGSTKFHLKKWVDETNQKSLKQSGFLDIDATLISEDLGVKKFKTVATKERGDFMALLRNKYLDIVKEKFSHFDYMIVIDADLQGWQVEHIIGSFGQLCPWDAITANGLNDHHERIVYYDLWARIIEGETPWILHDAYTTYSPMVKVESAFGGIGIYKIKSIMDAKYYPYQLEDGRYGAEHTGLHRDMIDNGFGNIFINPSMVTLR